MFYIGYFMTFWKWQGNIGVRKTVVLSWVGGMRELAGVNGTVLYLNSDGWQ